MTKELARWRHRIDLGDVIQSPRGEYVFWEDYDKLAKDFAALQSQWDDMQQGLLEVFGEPVQDAIELLGATEQLRSAAEPRVSRCTCIPAVTHDDYCATKSSAYQPPPPEILADALQDVVHTDPGPVRAGHAVREAVEQRAAELRKTGVTLIANSWRCQHGTVHAWPIATAACGCDRPSEKSAEQHSEKE